jgi:hypothetical protein
MRKYAGEFVAERQEIAMSGHGARVPLGLSRAVRERAFKNDAMRTGPALKFVRCGNTRLDPGRDAIQSPDASAPVTRRSLLESDPTQTRSLEGRPLTMSSTLRLPDHSRPRLLNLPPWPAPELGEQKRPNVWPQRALRAGMTTPPLASLAQEVDKWKTNRL